MERRGDGGWVSTKILVCVVWSREWVCVTDGWVAVRCERAAVRGILVCGGRREMREMREID